MHLSYKSVIWGNSLQGVQIKIPQNSRDISLLPLERDRGGFSTFAQNCFEDFPFVKSHQLIWERNARRGQIRKKAGAGDSLEQWEFLLFALDPRPRSTLSKTYHFSYVRATNSTQTSEGQLVFSTNWVSESSPRFSPFQILKLRRQSSGSSSFPSPGPTNIFISLISRSFPHLLYFSIAQKNLHFF